MTTPRRVLRHWLLILAVPLIALIWVAYRVHQLRRDVLASVAQCPTIITMSMARSHRLA